MTNRPVLLDSRASFQCERRIHNEYDPLVPQHWESAAPSAGLQMLFDEGRAFEERVREHLAELFGPELLDLTSVGHEQAALATLAALSRGVPLIVNGVLPDDLVGGRRGRPDLLVRYDTDSQGRAQYVPVDIKNHRTLAPARDGNARWTRMSEIPVAIRDLGRGAMGYKWRENDKDALQLAHYSTMLLAAGYAAPELAGGIIGPDDIDGHLVVTWIDLAEPRYQSADPDAGDLVSAMRRYTEGFSRRREVAERAMLMTSESSSPLPLVEPVRDKDCESCPWSDYCAEAVGASDASFTVGTLRRSDWRVLHDYGYRNVSDLAAIDPADVAAWRQGETPDSSGQELVGALVAAGNRPTTVKQRLSLAITRSQMALAGEQLRRKTTGQINVPRADIEIDLDMENAEHIYLWGLFRSDEAGREYIHVSNLEPMDASGEAALVAQLWRSLTELVAEASARRQSVRIYHYHAVETKGLQRIVDAGLDPHLPTRSQLDAFVDDHFVDLYQVVAKHFIGLSSLGLKAVANAAGFQWRREGADGLQSIGWLHEYQRTRDPEVMSRILNYNEDDVRATLHVRNWLAEQ